MARRKYRQETRPIRATSMWRVDQVFLNLSGQRIEVTCSLVNDDGGLRNDMTIAPTRDPREAVEFAARYIAGKGNVYRAYGARVRWTKLLATDDIDLVRDRVLEEAFLDAFEDTLAEVRDRMR
ncbi:hypothetical protein [Deinococcus misasensis]|uniref:hypothetical protein n=1 Tax=Deinococcus misasensis TaxID=392413 RepID=UPI00054F3F8F|nr:hypothetical protein [Deinococcus misasensis]